MDGNHEAWLVNRENDSDPLPAQGACVPDAAIGVAIPRRLRVSPQTLKLGGTNPDPPHLISRMAGEQKARPDRIHASYKPTDPGRAP